MAIQLQADILAFLGLTPTRFDMGTSGIDVRSGTSGSDYYFGGAGLDELSGGAGNDYIEGGTGADILTGMACSQALERHGRLSQRD